MTVYGWTAAVEVGGIAALTLVAATVMAAIGFAAMNLIEKRRVNGWVLLALGAVLFVLGFAAIGYFGGLRQ